MSEDGDLSVAFVAGFMALNWGSAAVGLLILGLFLMIGGVMSMYVKISNIEANTINIAESLEDLNTKVQGVDQTLRSE
jgi:hypothetical protein